jgi:hypothetical protein
MRSVRSTLAFIKTILFLSAVVAFPAMVARRLTHAPANLVDAIEKFALSK